MADLRYAQRVTIDGQEIEVPRNEVMDERKWSRFKTACVPTAGILLAWFIATYSYACGQAHPNCQSGCTPADQTTKTPASMPATTTPDIDTDRLASAIEKLAEAKPATSTATSTSTSTTQAVPPPTVVVRMPNHLTLEMKDPNPPPQAKADPAPPTSVVSQTTMTPEQECIDEVLRLRRSRQCN